MVAFARHFENGFYFQTLLDFLLFLLSDFLSSSTELTGLSAVVPLAQNTVNAYPCGSDHTPTPMASRTPLEAKAAWEHSAARLTAVAVSVREGHSIAFLGDSKGTLHKVCSAHAPPLTPAALLPCGRFRCRALRACVSMQR